MFSVLPDASVKFPAKKAAVQPIVPLNTALVMPVNTPLSTVKEPLVLTMLEGLPHKEAGALLGINAKAVETRVYRAKRQLAAMLDLDDLRDISGTD